MTRIQKRSLIIFIYILIATLIGLALYFTLRPAQTCSDGILNQKEEDVDCGGSCAACPQEIVAQEIIIEQTHIVKAQRDTYDFVAVVRNPNTLYGSNTFFYVVDFFTASGERVAQREGQSFILPRDTKHIVDIGIASQTPIARADMRIVQAQWQEFEDYEEPQLIVLNRRYTQTSGSVEFGVASGLLRNQSPFDFNVTRINVILKDARGRVLAVNRTQRNTFNATQEWDFRLPWSHAFSGVVDTRSGIVMEAETNVFDSQNFVSQYLPGGQFQNLDR